MSEARSFCDEGLQVYADRTYPLAGNFDWESVALGPGDDALYPIRPHRFGFAPILAQATLLDEAYLAPLDNTLRGWMTFACETKKNWAYVSNLVVLYRLIALTWTWHFLAAHDGGTRRIVDPLLENIFKILRADIAFLGPRLGDSYGNNHLLMDYFASWFISAFYPELADGVDVSDCEARFVAELQRQFYDDGGNFEHSVHYHELGCEAAVFYCLYKRRNGETPDPAAEKLVGRMLAFQVAVAGLEGRPWSIGDTTEDPLMPLAPGDGWSAGALREIDRSLFRPEQSGAPASDATRLKAFWLLSGDLVPPASSSSPVYAVDAFPQAGVLSLADGALDETLLLRTGPGPDSVISPGHLHADVLSLYWRWRGEDILVASGTYSYRSKGSSPESYRDYLRSPQAHSGLAISSETPFGPMEGDFAGSDDGTRVQLRHAHDPAIGLWCEGEVQSDTAYAGYRRGLIRVPGRYMVVYDLFSARNADLDKVIGWQFAPKVAVTAGVKDANHLLCSYPGGCLQALTSSGLAPPTTRSGDKNPLRGWVSERYGSLQAAPYVAFPIVPGTSAVASLWVDGDLEGIASVRAEPLPDSGLSIEVTGEGFRDLFLIGGDGGNVPAGEHGPAFSAAMLQISERQGRLEALTGLEIGALDWPEAKLRVEKTGQAINARFERTNDGFEATYSQNAGLPAAK